MRRLPARKVETSREQDRLARIPDLERVLSAASKLLGISNGVARLATQAGQRTAAQDLQIIVELHGVSDLNS